MGAREPAFFFVTAGTATTGTATTGTAKARPVTTKPVAGSLTTEPVGIYDLDLYNSGALGQNPNRTFHSSKIVAPKFGINIWDAEHLRAHSLPFLFLTATEPDSSASPFILNATDLSLVWADTTTHRDAAMNFRPQTYRGEKFLSFWEGINASGRGNGVCVLYDQSYQERYRVTAKDLGFGADLHECKLTHDGTALITVYNLVQYNLTGVGGQDYDQLLDCYFQEIDVETGDDRNGNYLISSRHLHTIALIAGNGTETPGEPIWKLNGKQNQFHDLSGGNALDFSWQHHARFRNDEGTEITLFDNHHPSNVPGKTGCTLSCSKAMAVRLNFENMTVSLVAEYAHPQSVQSGSMGSFQALDAEGVANGNLVVGWGSNPGVTEYTQDGKCVMDIQFGAYSPGYKFGHTVSSYRAFKGDWIGRPTTDPDLSTNWAAHEIYVSWNGATEVRSWAVYAGDKAKNDVVAVRHRRNVAKDGFETAIRVPQHSWVEVRGLDINGKVLGSTGVWEYKRNVKVAL
ncbi:ASST-domain-containing protein [Ilyonectria robusta]|uniref:ASST-domain-containing protein n=1 Tax=Ilyonectria robusta TaxID=1079257 RepID=UPI001E8DB21B|nr:ASST-domain-containing protein [Ilyonectria robusta]KAH8734145.1 ASST-domain-containing protein [Ilyonectria robusta]